MNRSTQHAFEPEEIMAYLDGELEARQVAAIASHLEHCLECQILTAQLRQVSERLLDFQIEPCPAPISESALQSQVPAVVRFNPKERSKPRWKAWFGVRHPFAWAGAFLIVALALMTWMRRGRYQLGVNKAKTVIQEQQTAQASNSRSFSGLATLAAPGAVADSNGLYHGLGDHAENSFSIDGQSATDQQSKVFGPMIEQTASIVVLASDYDQANGAIERVTQLHGGYVQDITANSQTGSARSLSATLRVPEQQLENFLADLRKLGHVEQETHSNEEITRQYVDLTARLTTSRATEQRILELLKTKTGNLSEVLQAEQELARIRGEIESMDRERAHMEHQVRYATVQVQLNEEYREQLNPESFSTGRRLRNSLVEGLGNLAGGITGAAIFLFAYGPSILFWLTLFGIPTWFIWRRLKKVKSA